MNKGLKAWIYVCAPCACLRPTEAIRGHQIFWNWGYGWLGHQVCAGNQTWSSVRKVSALHTEPSSQPLLHYFWLLNAYLCDERDLGMPPWSPSLALWPPCKRTYQQILARLRMGPTMSPGNFIHLPLLMTESSTRNAIGWAFLRDTVTDLCRPFLLGLLGIISL